ncbi:uncharacterized protein BDR25DRAFT_377543 [Lindgomyces ingoldianus]|uniref:Uncharacterized protein n=1 Tax=Lindgomyces ingoldianus TaxID=673940 RepID=A0ACB6QHK1_9PLEO|nr:uncharacterized protein BDR25DRAFT_377543 [Lindgomyces ingoldianus]KAF2466411.1 hypothetical protein BDR25DRAFT_377543 [Lindgomyces ingoldianus]
MKLTTFLFFLGCAFALPTTNIDPIPRPTITNFTYFGAGCPSGTVSTALYAINSTTGSYQVYTYLDSFTPWAGPHFAIKDSRKICTVNLEVGIAQGWKVRTNNGGSDVKGYLMLLDEKVTGTWRANYSFASATTGSISSIAAVSFAGPFVGIFIKHADAEGQGVVSPCGGGTLNVEHQVRLSSAGSTYSGYIGPDPGPDELKWTVVSGVEVLRC